MGKYKFFYCTFDLKRALEAFAGVADQGCRPPPPIRRDACLRPKCLHRQDRISLLKWLIFLMKRVLHIFATKLISKDIQKCNCFLVPSYDLFASARKAVFPAPLATGIHRLRNTWSSPLFQLVDNYGTRGECSKGASLYE